MSLLTFRTYIPVKTAQCYLLVTSIFFIAQASLTLIDVSVIIPTYNRHLECLQAIRSVIAQNIKTQIIVVDDGSDPPVKLSLKKDELNGHDLKIIRLNNNSGPSTHGMLA